MSMVLSSGVDIQPLQRDQFVKCVEDHEPAIHEYMYRGVDAIMGAEYAFGTLERPMPYHIGALFYTVELRDHGLSGQVALFRTRYGKSLKYETIDEDACFKKASIIIYRKRSAKAYVLTFRNIRGVWHFGLGDAERLTYLHDRYHAFSDEEVLEVIDALTTVPHNMINDTVFNGKYPTAAYIVR